MSSKETPPKTTRRVTEQVVKQAILELQAQGKKISVRTLLAHIGYGSMGTIAKYKQRCEMFLHNSPLNSKTHELVAATLTDEVLPLIEQRLTKLLNRLDIPLNENPEYLSLQAQLNTLNEELKHKDLELHELKQLYKSVLADRAEKTRTAISLKNRLTKVKEESQQKEQQWQQQNQHLQAQINAMTALQIDYDSILSWNFKQD